MTLIAREAEGVNIDQRGARESTEGLKRKYWLKKYI